jgi:hypothetical protein
MPPTSRIAMAASCCSPRCSVNFHSSRSYSPTAPIKDRFLPMRSPKSCPLLKPKSSNDPTNAKGFVPLPKRWIVERTLAWLNRCRRLAKDWENLNRNALAFLKLASIRLMLRKLCNP